MTGENSEGQCWINGQWINGSGAEFVSIDPARNVEVWRGRAAAAEEVDAAVHAARDAFPAWARTPLEQRIAVAQQFKALVMQHQTELARAIGIETGKPLWEARQEVSAIAAKVDISIQAYQERSGEKRIPSAQGLTVLRHRPHGVVAVFGPYNFPAHLPNGHIVPALIAGNTVVFKPSEYTPHVAGAMIELWRQTGLPTGALNLIQGERATGQALAAHIGIDGLFFTGSAAVGHQLHRQLAGHPEVLLALEMGGNNPLIVAHTEQLDAAVYYTVQSAFLTAGQRCTCARRLFAPRGDFGERFIARFIDVSKRIRIGRYDDEPQPYIGPVISRRAAAQLAAAQEKLFALGATPRLKLQHTDPELGFVTPGILDMSVVQDIPPDEEFFGPLVQLFRYDDFNDAIEQANQTAYGLSAGLLADDPALWERFMLTARAGIVNWNQPINGASSAMPFGGVGASGNHRPSAYYAADYCAYPMASSEAPTLTMPTALAPGLNFE